MSLAKKQKKCIECGNWLLVAGKLSYHSPLHNNLYELCTLQATHGEKLKQMANNDHIAVLNLCSLQCRVHEDLHKHISAEESF